MNLFSLEPPPNEPYQNPITVSLVVSLLAAWSGSFCMGISMGYTSPAADSLAASTGEKAEIFHTVANTVWFRSLLPIGAMLGSGIGALSCQLMGRRFALLLCALASMVGYAVIFAANSAVLLYSGRFLTGVACGIASLAAPAYVAEIALPQHRGTAGGALYLATTMGILYSYVLGSFLRWQLLAMACFAAAVLVVAASQFSAESPRWLLLGARKLEALQALLSLRGPHFRVENECVAIEQWFVPVSTPVSNVLLAFQVHLLQQLAGINMVIFYAHTLSANSGVAISAATTNIIIAGLQAAATLSAVSLMDFVGRRRMLTVSSLVCVFSMLALGAVYQTGSVGADASVPSGDSISERLPVVFLGLFIIGHSIGLGPVVWILGAELVPCRNHGLLLGIATAFNWACAAVVTCLFHVAHEAHFSSLAWSLSLLTFAGILVTDRFLPETQGQTLEHILSGQLTEREEGSLVSRQSKLSVTPRR